MLDATHHFRRLISIVCLCVFVRIFICRVALCFVVFLHNSALKAVVCCVFVVLYRVASCYVVLLCGVIGVVGVYVCV